MPSLNPWRTPFKQVGINTPMSSFRMERHFKQALTELSQKESTRLGIKVSLAVLLVDLSTRNGKFYEQHRSWLLQRTKQLKKGNENASTTIQESSINHTE
jgi:hypothetical protein